MSLNYDRSRRPAVSSEKQRYSEDVMEMQLKKEELMRPIMEKLHTAEQKIREHLGRGNNKNNNDANNNDGDEDLETRLQRQGCDWSLFHMWNKITEVWTQCDDGRGAMGHGYLPQQPLLSSPPDSRSDF